jgi:uncharacterized protein (TIGR04255 family)
MRARENSIRIPTKISPCPIVEAIVEIRFETDMLADAIFGIIYPRFKDQYPTIDKLPILQIPEEIRSNDPNLMYQPHYRLKNKNFIFQIGPKVISIISPKEYSGWKIFCERIKETFSIIENLNIIRNIRRFGIRYINFFEFDIFRNINLQIILNEAPVESSKKILRAEIPCNNFTNALQITNHAIVSIDGISKSGSIIDIDTFLEKNDTNFFKKAGELLEEGHFEEKTLLFTLLKPEFLKTLNPEY